MQRRVSRATLLKGLAGLAVGALSGKLYFDWQRSASQVSCRMLGPSMSRGHALRDGKASKMPDAPTENTAIVIVGGGIAGLSAGWWLKKRGFSDFVLLELEQQVGGNSSAGKNRFSAYPWGAHYVPVANKESEYVLALFEELGVIEGYDAAGNPIYNDLYLCHEPQERLFKDGSFQEGLVPHRGLQPEEKEELDRFFTLIQKLRSATGSDGRPAFAIPIELSSKDEDLIALDRISMAQWLNQNGFRTEPLLWYVNYCCRDDYGSAIEDVSAWAGIHYFAGRRGVAANAEQNSVVTWPEGNGFLVDKLKQQLDGHIKSGALVTAIAARDRRYITTYVESSTGRCLAAKSACVIFSAPRFLATHIVDGYEMTGHHELVYAPWLVANISLNRIPDARGAPLSWDNVDFRSRSLGYVVATHQTISARQGPTVITYYYPLSGENPAAARKRLLSTSADEWSKTIVDDLKRMHPGIAEEILSIDLWPWGHGMIRPSVGFIWGDTRRRMKADYGNVFFAHSDMSGISNFEEAQYQGVEAAKRALAALGAA
ncbi:MAG TPA: FAD-dependent oxidoreductase [Candidatus Obscuribacterales bacterium]